MKSWLSIVILLLIVSGCSKDKEETVEKVEPKEVESEVDVLVEEVEDVVIYPYSAPFTGERAAEEFTIRPVIVTINNHPKARPQSGIGSADIIYEMLAEGNVTRLLALFQSELPERIGPVRSARDYFIDISKGLDAFYVAHGYSPEARQMLASGVVDHINGMQYDGTLFKRSSDRVAPHNSYITGERILEGMRKVSAPTEIGKLPALSFYTTVNDVPLSALATVINVQFGGGEDFHHVYSYDTLTQQYNRSSGGIITTDRETNEDIQLANVLFFEVVHQTIDAKGRQQLDLSSGGKGYLFQAGVMKEIEWQLVDGVLIPMKDGQPAQLAPGKSWIHLVKTNPGIDKMVSFTP